MKRARRIEFLLLHMTPKSLPFAIAILIAAMTGGPAYPQHASSQSASGGTAWSELQQSMRTMHKAMSSLKSTGNNDEDFVRLMLPRHQAALDMAKTELLHGQDPQMRRLAQEIITDQQSEIELMQLWLRQHQPQNSQSGSSRPKAY
jgi:Domain of unknown function (DUF305)